MRLYFGTDGSPSKCRNGGVRYGQKKASCTTMHPIEPTNKCMVPASLLVSSHVLPNQCTHANDLET